MGLVNIIIVNVLSNICYTIILPFLPIEVKKFGLDETLYGYIFGIYALASMLCSLVVGKLLVRFGRKVVLISKKIKN